MQIINPGASQDPGVLRIAQIGDKLDRSLAIEFEAIRQAEAAQRRRNEIALLLID